MASWHLHLHFLLAAVTGSTLLPGRVAGADASSRRPAQASAEARGPRADGSYSLEEKVRTLAAANYLAWRHASEIERRQLLRYNLGGAQVYRDLRRGVEAPFVACLEQRAGHLEDLLRATLVGRQQWNTSLVAEIIAQHHGEAAREPRRAAGTPGAPTRPDRALGAALAQLRPLVRDCSQQARWRDTDAVQARRVMKEVMARIEAFFGERCFADFAEVMFVQEPLLAEGTGLMRRPTPQSVVVVAAGARQDVAAWREVLLHELLHLPVAEALDRDPALWDALQASRDAFDAVRAQEASTCGYEDWSAYFQESVVRALTLHLGSGLLPADFALAQVVEAAVAQPGYRPQGVAGLLRDVLSVVDERL